jgi:hypothetical protein
MTMIIIKTPQELQLMRESNRLVAEALQELKKLVVADITTEELDRFAEDFIRRRGAQPAFKGYRGYPASLCVSVNEEIVHGIPSKKKLRDGDIVSLDLGVLMNGFYGDAAITVPVGSVSPQVQKLLQVTEESLYRGIAQAKVTSPGPFKPRWNPAGSAWCGILSAMASEKIFMKSRRYPTSILQLPTTRASRRGWCLRLSPWSMKGPIR